MQVPPTEGVLACATAPDTGPCRDAACQLIDQRLWQALESSPIPTFILDSRHLVTHWNRACEEVTGRRAAQMIGSRRHWQAFYETPRPVMADLVLDRAAAEDIAAHYGGLSRPSAVVPGAYEAEAFFPAMGTDGTWLFFTAALLHDSSGRVIGAMETLQDISERKRAESALERHHHLLEDLVQSRTLELRQEVEHRREAEEALRAAHAQLAEKAAVLEQANEELSQYAYCVSHDLKAPLRAIRNYADFLRQDLEGSLEEEQQDYLDGLGRALRQAEDLVVDLLEFSRIGRTSVLVEPIPVGPFLRELVASLNLPAEVEVDFAPQAPIVAADHTLLHQIFQNLVVNAVKFNHSAPRRIRFAWTPAADGACDISVADNGIGIELRYQEQIFRMFQRLHTHKEYEGTGIGLAIVKKATQRLNGSVRLRSTPGTGSTFIVQLPLAQPAP